MQTKPLSMADFLDRIPVVDVIEITCQEWLVAYLENRDEGAGLGARVADAALRDRLDGLARVQRAV